MKFSSCETRFLSCERGVVNYFWAVLYKHLSFKISRLSTDCWPRCRWCIDWVSTVVSVEWWSRVNWGYRSRVSINTWPRMPLLRMMWNIYNKDKKCEVLINHFPNNSSIFESFKAGFHWGASISRTPIRRCSRVLLSNAFC